MRKNLTETLLEGLKQQDSGSVKGGLGAPKGDFWEEILSSGEMQARIWLNVCAGLMAGVFVLMVILIFMFRNGGLPGLAAITTVSGVTLAGAVRQLIHICRTIFEFETFRILIKGLPVKERAKIARDYLRSSGALTPIADSTKDNT